MVNLASVTVIIARELTIVLFASAVCLNGQSTATLSGRIADPNRGEVAGAHIVLSNAATGFQRELLSAEDGSFTVSNIPFQNYALTVEKQGFAAERREIPLRSNVPVSLEIHLRLLEVNERVEVTAFESTTLIDPE